MRLWDLVRFLSLVLIQGQAYSRCSAHTSCAALTFVGASSIPHPSPQQTSSCSRLHRWTGNPGGLPESRFPYFLQPGLALVGPGRHTRPQCRLAKGQYPPGTLLPDHVSGSILEASRQLLHEASEAGDTVPLGSQPVKSPCPDAGQGL